MTAPIDGPVRARAGTPDRWRGVPGPAGGRHAAALPPGPLAGAEDAADDLMRSMADDACHALLALRRRLEDAGGRDARIVFTVGDRVVEVDLPRDRALCSWRTGPAAG